MSGNKKEIIRELKVRLKICNGKKEVYRDVLKPMSEIASIRAERMEIMAKYIKDRHIGLLPIQFREWFNSDGVAL